MGIEDILRAADEAGGARATTEIRRFSNQIYKRSFGETTSRSLEGGNRVSVDANIAPRDWPSAFILDPENPGQVDEAIIRFDDLPEGAKGATNDWDLNDRQAEVLQGEAERATERAGIKANFDTRIRRETPPPMEREPGDTTLVPHVQFLEPVDQRKLLQFLDNFPNRLQRGWARLSNEL